MVLNPQIELHRHLDGSLRSDTLFELAKRAGVPRQLVGRNGDLFRIAPTPSVMRSAVAVGRLFDDGGQLKPVA